MTEPQRYPWPSSWPPLWRGVLHAVVAMVVINAAAGAAAAMLRPGEGDTLLEFAACAAVIVPTVPVLVLALLARISRRVIVALLAALSPFAGLVLILFAGLGLHAGFGYGEVSMLSFLPFTVPAFAVMGWLFCRTAQPQSKRLVWGTMALGTVLFSLGVDLMYSGIGPWPRHVPASFRRDETVAFVGIGFGLISASAAITATIFAALSGPPRQADKTYGITDAIDDISSPFLDALDRLFRWSIRIERDKNTGPRLSVLKKGETKLELGRRGIMRKHGAKTRAGLHEEADK